MGQVYLRALELSDLERTFKWHSNQTLYETLGGIFHYPSLEMEREWLEKKVRFSMEEKSLAICLTDSGEHIGNVYMQHIDWISRNAELHMFLGETKSQYKGLGTEALQLITNYAFNVLGLNRLYGFTIADNDHVVKHIEKVGYVVEGRLKKHVFKNGVFKDVFVFGKCNPNLD